MVRCLHVCLHVVTSKVAIHLLVQVRFPSALLGGQSSGLDSFLIISQGKQSLERRASLLA